jgi:2,3-bisphosphoglycerate-independent phosphoglycerate mutase
LVVTSDHTTSCSKKRHTDDPVPVLSWGNGVKKGKSESFSEKESKKGKKIIGKKLLDEVFF